jgi:hypothetical protein
MKSTGDVRRKSGSDARKKRNAGKRSGDAVMKKRHAKRRERKGEPESKHSVSPPVSVSCAAVH